MELTGAGAGLIFLAFVVGLVWYQRRAYRARKVRGHGVIAAIVDETAISDRSLAPLIMLAVGLLAMFLATGLESNAIRLAAWGAVWTGWNVLCGVAMLMTTRTRYVVYRELPPEN